MFSLSILLLLAVLTIQANAQFYDDNSNEIQT